MSNVIVLDSGVSDKQYNNIECIDVGKGKKDENGHGSQIVNVLIKKLPYSNVKSIKILDNENNCDLKLLIIALCKCLQLDAKIICLPLSVESSQNNGDLLEIIDQLASQGKIIISSEHNSIKDSVPAAYSNVIGVQMSRKDPIMDKFYSKESKVQCMIPGIFNIISESILNTFSYIGGNSLACAIFTTHIYELFEKKSYTLNELENLLSDQNIMDIDILNFFYFTNGNYNEMVFDEIKSKLSLLQVEGKINFRGFQGREITNKKRLTSFIHTIQNYGLVINRKTFMQIPDLTDIEALACYLSCQE